MFQDHRRGVSTSRRELASKDSPRHGYVPTEYATVRIAMSGVAVGPDDVFVDFGSGKGRTLLLACEYPFRLIIGIEFDEKLNKIALQNLQRALPTAVARERIRIISTDATLWAIPKDTNVLFFFNPFRGEVLSKVCENIRRSLAAAPRKITVIYVRPEQYFEKEIEWESWLSRTSLLPCAEGNVAIYESRSDFSALPFTAL